MKDFFFNTKYSDLSEINEIGSRVTPTFFTKQLNRYLVSNKNHMNIYSESSAPDFVSFISKLDPEQVGVITISCRTDLNEAVKATLYCDILLDQGVVSVSPQWCAYKDIRADEIISTLLVPIHLMGLQNVVYLKNSDGRFEALTNHDVESEIRAVFSLSLYPQQPTMKQIESLKTATDVGSEELSMTEKLNKHYTICHL